MPSKISLEVLNDRVISMRNALDQHIIEDNDTKERLFNYLNKMDEKADKRDEKRDKQNEVMIKKVDTLWDKSTREDGENDGKESESNKWWNVSNKGMLGIWAIIVLLAGHYWK